jgi:hypothetical protein
MIKTMWFRRSAYLFMFGSDVLIFGFQSYLVGGAWAIASILFLELSKRGGR